MNQPAPDPSNPALPDQGRSTLSPFPPRPQQLRLELSEEQERDFGRYHLHAMLLRMRWALGVAMALFLLFALLDAISLPEEVRNPVLGLRLGLILPVLTVAWLSTFPARLQPCMQWIGGAAALVCGLGVVGIIWFARIHAYPLPYEGILLVTFYFYFLTGLRFVPAALCGWVTFVVYLGMELQTGLPAIALLYNAFFLGTANIIGSVGCYFLEHAMRQNFLAQLQLQELAERDFLTGLLNRRAFSARAENIWRQALRERHSLGVAMMDVDYFKRYNDHYGHAAGDETLKKVAHIIGSHARRPLDITARYGGEEFVGLWYHLSEEDLRAIMERIRAGIAVLNLPHVTSEAGDRVSISIGVAYLCPQPHQGLEDALRLADVALYLAKEQGRNRVVCKRPGDDTASAG